jgi:hypothetical protein
MNHVVRHNSCKTEVLIQRGSNVPASHFMKLLGTISAYVLHLRRD